MCKAGAKQEFSYGALEGFITAKALVLALRAADSDLSWTGLLTTLESARFDLGGVPVRYTAGDHEGSRFGDLSIVGRDGKFVH